MNPAPYTEDTLVQQTTADYLEQQLGWESIYTYNVEDFGPNSLLGRASDREVVLTRYLSAALRSLNPDLPTAAYDDAVQQITATAASQTLVAANRAQYDLLRDGVQVAFRNDKGERVRQRLKVFDFETSENNHFLCVRELWVRGDLYRRRADIVGFVNGLPLLFIECKNIHRNLKAAFEQNFSDYKTTIPHLFHHNAVVMFGNGEQAKIGSITSQWEHFHEWKRLAEEEPGVVDMETLLKGVCDKRNFLDFVENFILFDESFGATRKILARNHQFLGVNRAVEAVHKRKTRDGKLGVFWHTQGAGKSYSMVMFTRKVHRKLGGNFTFLVLTDRDDLDSQIYKTFAGCDVVNHDRDPCRASDGRHLSRLLAEHKAYVFSLIQKFNANPSTAYTERDDVIVITDEAHRTQYGTLAINMRNALSNASYIGFTGTPLFKDDELTRRVFGEYVSTYDFQRAVEDEATVPLYYDARGDKLDVAIGDLNERIAAKLEEFEIDDIDVQQRLERALARDYHVIIADKRLDHIARDFVRHYSTAWETGKAMLVCIDKITCVRMHRLIEFYWNEYTNELEAELAQTKDEQTEKQIAWMRETRMAVVVSEEQGEVEKFGKWDLDIIPHRRLIKQGMELPASMRDKPSFRNKQRMDQVAPHALEQTFRELEAQGRETLGREGMAEAAMEFRRQADLRYVGQSHELTLPLTTEALGPAQLEQLLEQFHRTHDRAYGFSAPGEDVELVSVRLAAIGQIAKPALAPLAKAAGEATAKGQRPVYFAESEGYVDCPVYDRYALGAGAIVQGPAIIEEIDSTTVLHPHYQVRVDDVGQMVLAAAEER